MRIKALLFAAVFLAVSTNVFAFEHLVNENVSTTFTLRDGDNVVFLDNNSAWNIANRLVFGVSLVSGQELSGSLLVNGCAYKLDGYYKEVDFAYVRGVVVKYQGPEQIVRIQGWVDSSPVIARCEDVGSASVVVKDDDKKSQEELDWLAKKAAQQFQYAVRTAKYRDLGPLETVTFFEGPSENFKITKLPEWDFNRVYIQVEPTDGRKLNGHLYSNELDQKLSGWSISIPVNRKTDLPFDFELAFPEYRKVKLKWWATMEAAKEEPIQMSEKSLGGDSVEASYTFNKEIYGTHSVKLKFRKSDFVDGKIPVVKKYDVIPDGVLKIDSLKSYGAIGSVYDVHAEFKDDDTITFALPLDYGYIPNDYVAVVLHQVDDKWTPVLADSVVDGFVYFRTNSFSNFTTYSLGLGDVGDFIKDLVVTDACNMALGSYYFEVCQDAARRTAEKTFDGIVNGVSKIQHFLGKMEEFGVDLLCFDFEDIQRLFVGGEDEQNEPAWELNDGFVNFADVVMNSPENAKGTLDLLEKLHKSPLGLLSACKADDEVCLWNKTSDNLGLLLVDAILGKMKGYTRHVDSRPYYDETRETEFFRFDGGEFVFKDFFKISSEFVERAGWFVDGLQKCAGATNLDGLYIQRWVDFGKTIADSDKGAISKCKSFYRALNFWETAQEWTDDVLECSKFAGQNIIREYSMMDGKDDKLIAISEAMVRVSLLAWLDKEVYRDFFFLNYKKTYDGVHDWLKLASPLLMRNNIVAKALASLALFEYVNTGKTSNLDALNESLKTHYGPNGGYSEGMGYSQYIWDDVPYVLSALMDASSSMGMNLKIEEKFLKSPDYVFDFSRPIAKPVDESGRVPGLVPVEIDDGCTYNPDYRVWAKLKNDPKYLAMSEYAPLRDDPKKNVLTVFGFPESNLYNSTKKKLPDRGSLWGVNKDGLLMITALRKDKKGNVLDTVALSMIAESGDLWTNGQAHDQQDNLSITLTSRNDGFIIQDRGYSGFGDRYPDDNFHRYNAHNVALPRKTKLPSDNRFISTAEMRRRAEEFTGKFPGILQDIFAFLANAVQEIKSLFIDEGLYDFVDECGSFTASLIRNKGRYDFAVEGGSGANIAKESLDQPENGVMGYTADTYFSVVSGTSSSSSAGSSSSSASVFNRRSILYFGGSLWVIDRPNASDLTWLANSPIGEKWSDLKVHLYGSDLTAIGEDGTAEVEGAELPVRQHGNRADYTIDEKGRMVLSNYAYSFYDAKARTFVMSYAVNDEGFVKTADQCPTDYQCFENAAKDKRLVVPPQGEKFKLCDALPKNECSGGFESTGITMFMKNEDGVSWHADWVLDGEITEVDGGVVKYVEKALVSRLTHSALYSDGKTKSGRYQSTYLPANAILLR